ncbi:MAG: hypothetical protein ACTSXJ_01605 [Candidatus Baldrarchaeia archaeon]
MKEILISLLISLLPLFVALTLMICLKKAKRSELLVRICAAFVIFWTIYCVFSAMFFMLMGREPEVLITRTTFDWNAVLLMLSLLLAEATHAFIVAVVYYPLFLYPLIYVLAPIISVLILCINVGTSRLKEVDTWIDIKSYERMNWKEEVEFLKLSIVSLPVSLYFLVTILRLFGYEENPMAVGTTALGWIIEVFVVTLLAFILGAHILYAARVYHQGVFLGEVLKGRIFRGFLVVGLIMSIMSILTFLQAHPIAIYTILYFSAYYIMVVGIFLLFFRFFEPISVYIFVKLIAFLKSPRELRISPISIVISVMCAVVAVSVTLLFMRTFLITVQQPLTYRISEDISKCLIRQVATYNSILNVCAVLTMSAVQTLLAIVVLSATAFVTKKALLGRGIIVPAIFTGIAKVFTDIILVKIERSLFWEVFVFSAFKISNVMIFLPRSAFLKMDPILETSFIALFYPYEILKTISTILVLIIAFYLFFGGIHTFRVKQARANLLFVCERDGLLDRDTLFKPVDELPILIDSVELNDNERRILDLLSQYKAMKFASLLELSNMNRKELISVLKSLKRKKLIEMYACDLEVEVPVPSILGLYVVSNEGLPIYSEEFAEKAIDPTLISGMFSAISSFLKETVRSAERLRKIDHGDIIIVLEYGSKFFVALIVDRETPEIRMRLKNFVTMFEVKYGRFIKEGYVDLGRFADAKDLVREVFGEFLQ